MGLSPAGRPATRRRAARGRARWLVAPLAIVLLIPGCASPDWDRPATVRVDNANDGHSYWAGDGVSGPPTIVIDLSDQHAYFYKGKRLVGVSELSTGKEGTNTPIGKFAIRDKDIDHASGLFGDYVDSNGVVVKANIAVRRDPQPPGTHYVGAPMPYYMRIVGGVGMHQGYLPGYPASHGCIRMPAEMARAFYYAAPVGTPVQIRP